MTSGHTCRQVRYRARSDTCDGPRRGFWPGSLRRAARGGMVRSDPDRFTQPSADAGCALNNYCATLSQDQVPNCARTARIASKMAPPPQALEEHPGPYVWGYVAKLLLLSTETHLASRHVGGNWGAGRVHARATGPSRWVRLLYINSASNSPTSVGWPSRSNCVPKPITACRHSSRSPLAGGRVRAVSAAPVAVVARTLVRHHRCSTVGQEFHT